MKKTVFISIIAFTNLSGCATHPLVDDVTYNSFQIVQHIRCETAKALKTIIIQSLQENGEPDAIKLSNRLRDDRQKLSEIETKDLSAHYQKLWNSYKSVVLAYAFTFQIKEQNKAKGGLKFSFPFTAASLALDISSDNTFDRLGERKFTIAETIDQLGDSDVCLVFQIKDRGKHVIYPISGNVGMYEVLSNFYRVSRSVNTMRKFTDRIEYTTTISGNLNPKLTINSGSDLSEVSGELKAERKDVHQLLFTVELSKGGQSFFFPTAPGQPSKTPRPDSPAVARAKEQAVRNLEEAQQTIFLQELTKKVDE